MKRTDAHIHTNSTGRRKEDVALERKTHRLASLIFATRTTKMDKSKLLIPRELFEEVVEKIEKEISSTVKYHGLEHTIYVFEKVNVIGGYEQVSEHDLYLLQTAALFHDVGYVKDPSGKNHEKISVEYAEKVLPGYEYTPEDILEVKRLILSTDITTTPKSKLEQIIRDADVYMLGDEELAERWTKRVADEVDVDIKTVLEWELNFLEKHKFFTKYGRTLLEKKKKKNIKELERLFQQSQ